MTPEEQAKQFEKCLHKRSVPFEGNFFSIVQDEFTFPTGTKTYDVLKHRGAVAIIPITAKGEIIFVRQYRHSIEEIILEVPAGKLDNNEDPAVCAKRELQEEIGFYPNSLAYLGPLIIAPGYADEKLHIFLAKDLTPSTLPHDDTEAIEVVTLPLKEALAKVKSGEIRDCKTIACIHLYSATVISGQL